MTSKNVVLTLGQGNEVFLVNDVSMHGLVDDETKQKEIDPFFYLSLSLVFAFFLQSINNKRENLQRDSCAKSFPFSSFVDDCEQFVFESNARFTRTIDSLREINRTEIQ